MSHTQVFVPGSRTCPESKHSIVQTNAPVTGSVEDMYAISHTQVFVPGSGIWPESGHSIEQIKAPVAGSVEGS